MNQEEMREFIKDLVIKKNFTFEEITKLSGLGRSTIWGIMKGKHTSNMKTQMKLEELAKTIESL